MARECGAGQPLTDAMSTNIAELIMQTCREDRFGTLDGALRKLSGRNLWLLYHEALAHEATEREHANKRLAAAVAGKIGAEAVRRMSSAREEMRRGERVEVYTVGA